MNKKTFSKVTKFLAKEFKNGLGNLSIFREDNGSFSFFDRYFISEESGRYIVTMSFSDNSIVFSSLRAAAAWCVFDNQKRYNDAKRIEYLDLKISSADIAIDIHTRLVKKSKDSENTLIHLAKLNEEKLKKSLMVDELSHYISDSQSIQTKKFLAK